MKIFEVIFKSFDGETESQILNAINIQDATKEAIGLLSEFRDGFIRNCYIELDGKIVGFVK